MPKTVFLALSGGVDSAVSAALLKGAGYQVVCVYMKNWSRNLPSMHCPWAEDLADAKRIAVQLGLDFRVFDFETDYKHKVVDYMLAELKKGRTPNPDIMCNQEIKFKLFYDVAREQGADLIATGHYAQVRAAQLLKAVDENKDQTYFLHRISAESLAHTLFPVGHLKKPNVKALAAKFGFANAYKKESMGICFVGEANLKEFLRGLLPDTVITPGEIRDAETDTVLGYHDGAILYTLGQRHGLDLGGGLPYYVVKKDMDRNIVYVSRNLNHDHLWAKTLTLTDLVIRPTTSSASKTTPPRNLTVRLRHRAPLIPAAFNKNQLIFDEPVKRPAPGQSAALYDGEVCIGGGIIC